MHGSIGYHTPQSMDFPELLVVWPDFQWRVPTPPRLIFSACSAPGYRLGSETLYCERDGRLRLLTQSVIILEGRVLRQECARQSPKNRV